jgi:hypothetical protein
MSTVNDKSPWTDADRDRLASLYFSVPKPPVQISDALCRLYSLKLAGLGWRSRARSCGHACHAGGSSFPVTLATASVSAASESTNWSVRDGESSIPAS